MLGNTPSVALQYYVHPTDTIFDQLKFLGTSPPQWRKIRRTKCEKYGAAAVFRGT
ncbi:MAG: hypothetical protein NZ602_07850 [Thermoguttaceae bacterium]|nr:hypothetical protein [Thermoguttaceae bacterium]MDW8038436.1 hypothetical protein [Thermoguttaceae bacterium]